MNAHQKQYRYTFFTLLIVLLIIFGTLTILLINTRANPCLQDASKSYHEGLAVWGNLNGCVVNSTPIPATLFK